MGFFGSNLNGLGEVLEVPLQQQVQMVVNDVGGHFHRAAAFFQLGLGFVPETAVRILVRLFHMLTRVDLRKFLLLGADLDHQALAQVPRANPGRVQMLHQVDAPPDQFQRPCRLRFNAVFGKYSVFRRNRVLRNGSVLRRNRVFRKDSVRRAVLVCLLRRLLIEDLAKHRGHFLFAGGQVAVLIEIAHHELRRVGQPRLQGQSPQLPRQVIGQSRRLR